MEGWLSGLKRESRKLVSSLRITGSNPVPSSVEKVSLTLLSTLEFQQVGEFQYLLLL